MADYPFTTVEPVLGTLERDDRQLVLADIPGLIEGASAGAGLGHEFLAHVERCRLLVHVLDLAPLDGSDPAENFADRGGGAAPARPWPRGAAAHPGALEGRPRPGRDGARGGGGLERAPARLGRPRCHPDLGRHRRGPRRAGGRDLRPGARRPSAPDESAETPATHRVYRPGRGDAFRVERAPSGAFRVAGEGVERLIARHDLDNEDALRYVEERLRTLGVIRALEAAGFEPGDDVEIGGVTFELDPGAPFG